VLVKRSISPDRRIHAKAARLRTETPYEAKRDPVVSCRWTAKPYPTDPTVDGELVQRKFTFLFGEVCDAYPQVGLARKAGRPGVTLNRAHRSQQRP